MARATARAVDAVGGYAGGVYLRSGTPGLLLMAVLAGLPGRLMRPWCRLHVNRPFPVAEVYRSGRPVYLGDAEVAMRRFPQLMAGLPFPFASLYVPVRSGATTVGVLLVLRHATRGRPVAATDRRRLEDAAEQLGAELTELERDGTPIRWEGEPLAVRLPAGPARPVRVGHFTWDPGSGDVTADDGTRVMFGTEPVNRPPRTMDELTARLPPEDVAGLWTLGSMVARHEGPRVRRLRLCGPDGRALLLELSGRGSSRELTGVLLDTGGDPVVPEATDRLPRGVFTLDRTGRVTYVNRPAEELLGLTRAELSGRTLAEALPWLAKPAYGDQIRAALFSDDPVYFLARHRASEWLSVAMFPGHDGITVTVSPSGRHTDATEGAGGKRGLPPGSPADRAAVLYRPVALAIALTEAMTARQVSAVVTDELLPAFGGRQLAIYLQHERHLHLAWETGFPRGFLDRFEGIGLDAEAPGAEALATGRPLFFESMEKLAEAYPGTPGTPTSEPAPSCR